MQEQIERDLKSAMLAGDKTKAETLRGLKSALQNEQISLGVKDSGLSDEQMQKVLIRESKKRTEAAQLYRQAGESGRAEAEQTEKAVIDAYLPEQPDESAIVAAVEQEIAKLPSVGPKDMGRVIGSVRAKLGARADGATIAAAVKKALGSK